MNKKNTLIQIKNFSFAYAIEPQKLVLEEINLEIELGTFNVFCGMSGSGKTTLLRHLKSEITPKGKVKGEISFFLENENLEKRIPKIAFVMQNPNNQIIMDTVWHELAFGLENQGISSAEIERRIAEITNFFGIEEWLNQSVDHLSGGEKQILNLASNLIMQPDILILDEPTTQLDPIAKRDFLQMLFYIHAETGITILISEHNLNDLLEKADQVIFLDQGKIAYKGEPRALATYLIKKDLAYQKALPIPSLMQKYIVQDKPALSIIEGRENLKEFIKGQKNIEQIGSDTKVLKLKEKQNSDRLNDNLINQDQFDITTKQEIFVQANKLWFRYQKNSDLILKEASLDLLENQILAIVGSNGSGKSTLLYLLSKALVPLKGNITIQGRPRIAMLGQNPETIFSQDQVEAVLREFQNRFSNDETEIEQMIETFELNHLLKRHPFDLSGGEKQKLALAKVLLTKPDILLLDEPTNSLDVLNKEKIKNILLEQKKKMTIIFVTHDLDFAAETADQVAMLFNKKIVAQANTREFFQKNTYFTTTTYRLTRNIVSGCINFSDLAVRLTK